MNEQKHELPAAMVDAATRALYEKDGHDYAEKDRSLERGYWQRFQGQAEVALRAAGVPDLVAQYNEACKLLAVRVEAKRLDDAMTRIMELEAALRDRICERCDKLMANVGQLHLCGCQDQWNLCSACKAGCACAGGE